MIGRFGLLVSRISVGDAVGFDEPPETAAYPAGIDFWLIPNRIIPEFSRVYERSVSRDAQTLGASYRGIPTQGAGAPLPGIRGISTIRGKRS